MKIAKLIFRRESAVVLMTLLRVVSLGAALVILSTNTALGIICLCVTFFTVLYIQSLDMSPVFRLGLCLPMLFFPHLGGIFYLVFLTDRHVPSLPCTAKNFSAKSDKNTENFLLSCGFPLCINDAAEYYPFGRDMLKAMLDSISRAKRSIYLEFFIVSEGKALDMMLSLLTEKAAMGVDVRLIIDGAGCAFTSPRKLEKMLKSRGIKLKVFNKISPRSTAFADIRDHRKLVISDSDTAFCGGINIADEYFGFIRRFGVWKDGGFSVTGEAARVFESFFLCLWEGKPFKAQRCAEPDAPVALPFFSSPALRCALPCYLSLIWSAKRYIFITTPYLIIDDELTNALCAAAGRGVDVRLVLPAIPDKKYVFLITRSNYPALLGAGVKIYEYRPGFIHSKLVVTDDETAVIGTVNLDYRSMSRHLECGCLFRGGDVVSSVKRDILDICGECLTVEKVRKSIFVKIARVFLELLAPLM